jgi:hypothetical protein
LHFKPNRPPLALPLALYLVVSILYFGLPVAAHPGRTVIGSGSDPGIFIWMFAWWPHALLHGLDPFKTTEIWTPDTYNLAWTTSVAGLAVLLAPVTLLAGPVASANLAAVLMPALAAWTAYLLCRHLTNQTWPSLVGGYLFGFSSYMLGQEEGHLHMTSVFLVPLAALLVLRYLDGATSARRVAILLGVVLGLQLWFSTEVFVTASLALAVALVLAFAVVPARRQRLRELVGPLAGAYALALVVASPLIIVTLNTFQSGSINRPRDFPADLLNPVVPTHLSLASLVWGKSVASRFVGGDSENGAYLGLPVLIVIVLFAVGRRRTAAARFLIGAFALTVLLALGTQLHVEGGTLVRLPMWVLAKLPVFDNVLPVRLSMYLALCAAVIVALWAATERRRWLAIGLPVLALVAVAPRLGAGHWKETPVNPPFFADAYEHCLVSGDTVLALPFGSNGDSMLWQAESGFRFRLAGGYLSPLHPERYEQNAVFPALFLGQVPGNGPDDILAFARSVGATVIVVAQRGDPGWARFLTPAIRPRRVGGVVAFPLVPGPEGSAACLHAAGH